MVVAECGVRRWGFGNENEQAVRVCDVFSLGNGALFYVDYW